MEELQVLYEDNQVIVVIKPQNIPSQQDASGDMDLLTLVKQYIKQKYNKKGDAFVGLVHRLDRPTGGIVVFARTSKAASRLSQQLKQHTIAKTYYAVCQFAPQAKSGALQNYLKKDEKTNTVKIVTRSDTGAKEAKLLYKVLQSTDAGALLEVQILTGRSHQIRVQLAGINCPLVGDSKYGKAGKSTTNLGLWAGKLEFDHPTTKQRMVFVALPDTSKKPWSDFNMNKFVTR